ncbi:MAG TPA: 16S rRNA (cytosine(967)-C(5))-methyltransferase RsmB, partial [Armatimonadota bacterium]|nr:16S rRNA (cytosine(967)-C(5))-methyltransferase RsmB [Armatimonadota bacterium]
TPRSLALDILLRVEKNESANAVLDQLLAASNFDTRDRGLVTELVDGTLRWQGRLDYELSQFLDKSLDKLEPPIRIILRLGAYQLTRLERIPPHAAVNESVALAREYGHEGTAKLVNAVLRRLQREYSTISYPDPDKDPIAYLSIVYSHPEWLVARWLPRFGFAETEALLKINNTPPPLTIRVNRRWITREGLHMFLEMHGVNTEPTSISPWGLTVTSGGNPRELDEYHEGLFSIQGEGSMVMVELLRPGRNRDGWDLAAGVGGKTTYLAEWVDDSGSLLATDTSEDRLQVLQREANRLELHSITVEHGDATAFPVTPGSKDYALLDAPCSGTGSLRRQADARWKKTPGQITELTALQTELIEAAARAIRDGGILLYCTCSLEPEEDEEIVTAFLARHPEWSLEIAGSKHRSLPDNARDSAGYVHLFPQLHGTDGFFAARLVKKLDSDQNEALVDESSPDDIS